MQVLLSLGVSYTNELDQAQALNYLHRWLSQHPTHSPAANAVPDPGDRSQRLAWVMRSFEEAATTAPADGDLQVSEPGSDLESWLAYPADRSSHGSNVKTGCPQGPVKAVCNFRRPAALHRNLFLLHSLLRICCRCQQAHRSSAAAVGCPGSAVQPLPRV